MIQTEKERVLSFRPEAKKHCVRAGMTGKGQEGGNL